MKPEVPSGPITFGGGAPPIQIGTLRKRLAALCEDPLLDEVDSALREEQWGNANALLMIMGENLRQAAAMCGRVVWQVDKTRRSPLLTGDDERANSKP